MALTKEQVMVYEKDGLLCGLTVMEPEQVRLYRELFDQLAAKEGREKSQVKLFDRHFDQQFIWDIATCPKILDCVAALMGPNLLLLSTQFFCKYGPDDKFVAWHQDLKYWGLEPREEVTAWIAIDASDRENGCMRVIPRTHGRGMLEHGKSKDPGNLLSINQEVEVSPEDEAAAVDCILKAGEMSLHDGMAIHGSLPNRSTRRRCGLVLRYIPTHLKPLADGPIGTDLKWRPILVRGQDREKNFNLSQPPFPIKQIA